MESRTPPLALAPKRAVEHSDVLVRSVSWALRSGHARLEEVEAALAEGLTQKDPALRALAEALALAVLDRSLIGGPRPRNAWPGLLADPMEIPAAPARRRAGPSPEEREARARDLVGKLPAGRNRRLEAVNLRPTLYRGAAVARAFLGQALAALPKDPQASADWAELAELAAGQSSSRRWPGEDPVELEALAFRAELYKGNARRVLGDLNGAEETLCGAVIGARHSAVKDIRFWAEEKAFRASLRRDQRRFESAIHQGLLATILFKKLGDQRWQVTQLWQLASVYEQLGDYRQALAEFRQALAAAQGLHDDALQLGLRHGEVSTAARAGLYSQAFAAYQALEPEYARFPEHRNRQRWVLGLIQAGRHKPTEAEAAFGAARDGFLAQKYPYDAALVTLDWSLFLLDQDRPEEVLPLAISMGQAFEALGVARETLASWAIFQTAAERHELSRAVTESMVRTLGEERAGAKPGR